MMQNDLISVIVPVYNVEKYLTKCVDSIKKQTYSHLEILLIDDGSTDSSGELCDKLAEADTRIRVIHQKNGGLSCARNTGIAHAKGKYLSFVDSDDWVKIDMIEYLYSLIQKFHCRMSVCQHAVVKNGHEYYQDTGNEYKLSSHDCIEGMLYHKEIADTSAWAKLYDTSLFDTIKWPEGKLFEDIGTVYQLFEKSGTIACGECSKYYYFIRGDSITTSSFSPRKLDLLEMTDKMARDVLAWYPDLEKGVLRRRMYARFSTLNQMISGAGEYVKEKNEIIEFIKQHAREVLLDSKTPKRDRIAILSLLLSVRLYFFLWRVYKRHW